MSRIVDHTMTTGLAWQLNQNCADKRGSCVLLLPFTPIASYPLALVPTPQSPLVLSNLFVPEVDTPTARICKFKGCMDSYVTWEGKPWIYWYACTYQFICYKFIYIYIYIYIYIWVHMHMNLHMNSIIQIWSKYVLWFHCHEFITRISGINACMMYDLLVRLFWINLPEFAEEIMVLCMKHSGAAEYNLLEHFAILHFSNKQICNF